MKQIENTFLSIPKKVFIVPYRNRIQHKFFFLKQMTFILEDTDDYEIYFSHQCDTRTFNRGAVRNIGFLAVKNKYPYDYKNITIIFNDVDTIPFHKIFNYDTTPGVVKHYYGYKYALGGIVVIKGADFERINGYPCYWGWGMEDNTLQKRCQRFGLNIDRTNFYKIGSPEILQLFDGISRIISRSDPWRSETDKGTDGLITISKLKYTIDNASLNPADNVYSVDNPRIFYVNISTFSTETSYDSQEYFNYDLREPKRQIIKPNPFTMITNNSFIKPSKEDWTNIPFYPTNKERRELSAETLTRSGKFVPTPLINQIQQDKINELKNDVYNKNIIQIEPSHKPNSNINTISLNTLKHPIKHIYAPGYAASIGQKPKAQASARIRLGGVY
jgi:hypothetical protein